MPHYTVSIIIPTLNEEKWIERCVYSLCAQSYPFEEMQILIIDGGSTDNTRSIVESLSKRFSNISILDNKDRIQAVAFNIGVENSTAPIVIRLDAHSTYDINYVRLIIENLKDEKYGNVGGRWIIKSQRPGLIPEANAIINQMRFAIGGADYRVGDTRREVETVPFGGFRREVLQRIGPMNPKLPRGEDNEYNRRILNAGYKILLDSDIIAYYYARDTLKTMIKQMYSNGFSIGILWHCYRECIGIRHLIPLIFILSILCLGVLSFFFTWARWIFATELCLYVLLDVFATIMECRKYGIKYLIILPWLILTIHISYGWGTIVGLLKRKY